MAEELQKTKITQDFLYEYLLAHDVIVNRLQELMGVSIGIVMGCFHHDLNRYGKPLVFSAANVERLNQALPQLAAHVRSCLVSFGSAQVRTGYRGVKYDPAAIEGMKQLARYFKINAFCKRVLGWSTSKKNGVLCYAESTIYGNVSSTDVARVNAELLAVASMLSGIEVEPTE